MSVPPRRGLNRRPARGFGQKKDSSLGKPPSRSTKKKRFSISDAFKRAQERRNIRKIKREQQKKLREYGLSKVGSKPSEKATKRPTKIKTHIDPKMPNRKMPNRKKATGGRPKGSGQRVRRGFTKGRGF